jgi:hypothetical protein
MIYKYVDSDWELDLTALLTGTISSSACFALELALAFAFLLDQLGPGLLRLCVSSISRERNLELELTLDLFLRGQP